MDPVTHGLIGATAVQSTADRKNLRYAAIIGLLSAMLADLDVLIRDPQNPLLNLEFHRQFSHSLLFIPVGALLATGLLWWFFRNHFSLKTIYYYCFLGYATSGIADAFTSYGTKLLWPFIDGRFSWNIISVFDPLFTLGILIAVLLSSLRKKPFYAWLGGGWMALYLLFGFVQHERGRAAARALANQRNHHIDRMVVKPTLANTLLWSIRYTHDDSLYAAGLHLSPFSSPKIYKGETAPLLMWEKKYRRFRGTTLYNDIRRFSTLSSGFLIQHPEYDNVIGDGRYSMLPTTLHPLWGIRVDTTKPERHLPFETFRNVTPEIRSRYLLMLQGAELHTK